MLFAYIWAGFFFSYSNCVLGFFKIPDLNQTEHDESKKFVDLMDYLDNNEVSRFTSEQLEGYYHLITTQQFKSIDPEAYMTVSEIIKYNGYPVEEYIVETDDGYLLTIHRIPYGKNESELNQLRKPVLIQHGLSGSSAVWVLNTPDKNLAYILADAGYDVWLGNVRGSSFGLNNTHLSPNDKIFWEFSFDQMAKYDIPAVIQKMLDVTGFKQIHYIGHSMGTTILFALLSSQPQYNNIIRAGFTLAPVVSTRHITGGDYYIAKYYKVLHWLITLMDSGKMNTDHKLMQFLARTLCNSPIKIICEKYVFFWVGVDYAQTNVTRMPVFLYHVPDSSSSQTFFHYGQLFSANEFQYFDYGKAGNVKHYNQTLPPVYDLSKISAPIALFWSNNDYLADPIDVSILASKLPNVSLIYQVPYNNFNHLDFMWAIDVKELLYDKLLKTMNKLWK